MKRSADLFGLFLLLAAFAAVKVSYGDGPTIGDQGVYYYASWLWSQGIVPYRDFFMSHPPVHLLLPTLSILAAGTNLTLLDALSSLLGLCSGSLIFFITRKNMDSWSAFLASAFFLFSYAHLVDSSHLTGVNEALFLLLLGIFLFLRGKQIVAGMVFGAAVLGGIYTAPVIAAVFFVLFLRQRSSLWKFAASFALTTLILHGIFVLMAGGAFLEQVYLYHLAKTGSAHFFAGKSDVFLLVMRKNALLLILALCGIPSFFLSFRAWQRGEKSTGTDALRLMQLALFAIGMMVLFLLFLRSIFSHYFLLLVPFVAISAVFPLAHIPRTWPHSHRRIATFAVITLLFLHVTLAMRQYGKNREEKRFESAPAIAAYLSSSLAKGETLYGDFAVTPTLALLSGRSIAAHEVDSSIERFVSGVSSLEDVIAGIERDNVRLIITRPHRGIAIYPPFREYLQKNYRIVRRFDAGTPKEIDVWK